VFIYFYFGFGLDRATKPVELVTHLLLDSGAANHCKACANSAAKLAGFRCGFRPQPPTGQQK
jgi:hypothetical protein